VRLSNILRRNPERVEEIAYSRRGKEEVMKRLCEKKNIYLIEHPRAKVETAINEIKKKIEGLKIGSWLKVEGKREEVRVERG